MAYEMLLDDVPFTGETIGTVCVAILQGVYEPATHRRPVLPPAVDDWFARALAPKAADRFATARELAHAFRTAVLAQDIEDEDSRDSMQSARVATQIGLVGGHRGAPGVAPRDPIDVVAVIDDAPPPAKRRFRALALGGVVMLGATAGLVAIRGIDVASSATPPVTIEIPRAGPPPIAATVPSQATAPPSGDTVAPPEPTAAKTSAPVPADAGEPAALPSIQPSSVAPPAKSAPAVKPPPSREDYGF
jgi:serine/threonine-protein kinase